MLAVPAVIPPGRIVVVAPRPSVLTCGERDLEAPPTVPALILYDRRETGYDRRETRPLANGEEAFSKTRRLVPVEVRIVAEKDQAFQPFGLDEHFGWYPFSFDPKIGDETVNSRDNGAVNHLVACGLLDIAAGRFGK